MRRHLTKGPFCDDHLMRKVEKVNAANTNEVLQNWARRSKILQQFVEYQFAV